MLRLSSSLSSAEWCWTFRVVMFCCRDAIIGRRLVHFERSVIVGMVSGPVRSGPVISTLCVRPFLTTKIIGEYTSSSMTIVAVV